MRWLKIIEVGNVIYHKNVKLWLKIYKIAVIQAGVKHSSNSEFKERQIRICNMLVVHFKANTIT